MNKYGIHFSGIVLVLFSALLLFSCKSRSKKYTTEEIKTYNENLVKANRGLVKIDQDEIANYVSRKKWNMQKTETGLWYEIIRQGNETKAKTGMIAQIRYQVSLLDGTMCYNSDSLGIKEFKIGQGGIESGLEEGILLLNEGSAARFIMPPHLAYGLLGDENKIPPRSTIVYNVELLKLTH